MQCASQIARYRKKTFGRQPQKDPICHFFVTIFRPAVSASSDLSGQRSVLRQGREGAVGRLGATIVGIATFVESRSHRLWKEGKRKEESGRRSGSD